jgi:hypothetical protein
MQINLIKITGIQHRKYEIFSMRIPTIFIKLKNSVFQFAIQQ